MATCQRYERSPVGQLPADGAEELPAVDVQVVRPLRRGQRAQVGLQAAQVQVVAARLHVHAALPAHAHAQQPRLLRAIHILTCGTLILRYASNIKSAMLRGKPIKAHDVTPA